MEVIDVIRKRVTEWAEHVGHPKSTDMTPIEREIVRIIKQFFAGITTLMMTRKLILNDPERTVKEVFTETLSILQDTFGPLDSTSNCRSCNQSLLAPKYFYRGVGQADVQHAIIARELKVESLITFDKGFRSLSQNPSFLPMRFDIR